MFDKYWEIEIKIRGTINSDSCNINEIEKSYDELKKNYSINMKWRFMP